MAKDPYKLEREGKENEIKSQRYKLENLDLLWLQKQNVMIKTILGYHYGIIRNIIIINESASLNILTFGQVVNRSLYGLNKDWWIIDK